MFNLVLHSNYCGFLPETGSTLLLTPEVVHFGTCKAPKAITDQM